MRILFFTCLTVSLFFSSCGGKEKQADNPLSRQQLEAVLVDLMRADLFISNYMVIKDTALNKKKQGIELYTQVLKIHKVTEQDFKKSFLYYRSRPELLKDLMDSINHRKDTTGVPAPQVKERKPLVDSVKL